MKNGLSAHAFTVKFLEPWNAHDIEAVLASLPDKFEWQFTVGSEPTGAVYRGKTELRIAVERLFANVPDINYDIVELYEGPNHIVMEVLVTGTSKETGAALKFQACDIVIFDGEQLIGKRSYRKVVNAG